MAWNYASYVGRVAAAGKAEYPLPMFVNNACSMPRPGRPPPAAAAVPSPKWATSGKSPRRPSTSAGRTCTPRISPCGSSGTRNPSFRRTLCSSPRRTAIRALTTSSTCLGSMTAWVSPRLPSTSTASARPGAKAWMPADLPLARSYGVLAQLAPVILENQGKGKMAGVVVGAGEAAQKIPLGNYVLEVSYPGAGDRRREGGPPRLPHRPCLRRCPWKPPSFRSVPAPSSSPWGRMSTWWPAADRCRSGSLRTRPGDPIVGILSIEEGAYADGRWVPGRRLNGDENGGGSKPAAGRRFEPQWADPENQALPLPLTPRARGRTAARYSDTTFDSISLRISATKSARGLAPKSPCLRLRTATWLLCCSRSPTTSM